MTTPIISFPLQGPPFSSAYEYLTRTTRSPSLPSSESDLLKAIRIALRGSDTDAPSTIQSTPLSCDGESYEEDQLAWNAHTIVLSRGGVMKKKWNFEQEEQCIQWACIGWLEQQNTEPILGSTSRVPGVFVFLRSFGKIYLNDGLEYTFALPFIVRKAWPLSPHGVMIQRVLEPSEIEEAEISGDAVLPTIFSVTSPFSEAATVGLTGGIIGGFKDLAPSLKSEDENVARPLKSVSPTEMVVWVSHRGSASNDDVLVTVDVEQRRLSVWRYVYTNPKDRRVVGDARDSGMVPIEHGRMKAACWMEKTYHHEISISDARSWRNIPVALFDDRWDGKHERSLLAICLTDSQSVALFSLEFGDDNMLKVNPVCNLSAISIASLRITRSNVWDLLLVKPDHRLAILTHGLCELPCEFRIAPAPAGTDHPQVAIQDTNATFPLDHGPIVSVQANASNSVIVTFRDGWRESAVLDLVPQDRLTSQCLHILALTLPPDSFFTLHRLFLQEWYSHSFGKSDGIEFDCFALALSSSFGLSQESLPAATDVWTMLGRSRSHRRFLDDPVLKRFKIPPTNLPPLNRLRSHVARDLLAPVLYALHTLGEDLRLSVHHYPDLLKLVPVICRIALLIRPEWADYWKRLCPHVIEGWANSEVRVTESFDDRVPVWPPDISAILYGRISNPDWHVPWHDTQYMASRFGIIPSFAFGRLDPLSSLGHLTGIYRCLADKSLSDTQKRAENAILYMTTNKLGSEFLDQLPIGIAAPLREAARTCQLAPPGDWPLAAYQAIGRNDLAASVGNTPDALFKDGYKPRKEFINPTHPRRTIGDIVKEARASGSGHLDAVSGVELDLAEFTDIRFGQDRRLEEVARILCSAKISSVKCLERPDLSEHDQAKEHQNQVVRIAERTLALPFGRAMFTFGSVPTVSREAYAIPKLEYSVRIQPLNVIVTPEAGKISPDSLSWGDFHNGVAAGLRISPFSGRVESSWIAFNKPSDLTPEHAGFLFALGLTGHLKEMLTWHTFGYLTPKHDLTSIGVLLGLAAANIGNGNEHVTKLLAVHTPALLPTPTVDLNVSLLTQGAGLAGVGLLYLGTKNRRMAEVCLNQISRKDLVQPDLSNEHREAYSYSAALAFGMIMLGKGSPVPADMALVARLSILIHDDANSMTGWRKHSPFDINLTSPAATIALGLMYLKTERQDIVDILTIPDTVLELNRLQPSLLLVRTIARSLIMWGAVAPSSEWLMSQLPTSIREAMDAHSRGKPLDDAIELAYYNIVAGSCFVIGLKFAGTARQAAYMMVIRYFDIFTRLVYSTGPAFDHKIKRSAYRDGLNLISISLSMVMAGTGEITCFRRLRYAFGVYQQALSHQPFKYGIHMATHMAIGLLFLGGGRFTLGTSDAAIACMVAAFFPRFNHMSSDNKSYLQALRHLWVVAVEPRCLIARDVDTTEVVYLPVKITVKEGNEIGTTQLISPTLIPEFDKLLSIRVDTPRYWPFYLDTEHLPFHKQSLLRNQTLFVKRRTAFLSYTEDPRGSRSLFVRSGTSAGDAATLDFPQLTDIKIHPAGDLSEFITSFSNDVLFLAFADHFSHGGETTPEKLFHTYCHAVLLDSILQDKPQTLQSHLTLFLYRSMSPKSRYFHLRLQDLRFAADFYGKIYDRRFSGRAENNPRPPLIRDNTMAGALHVLDKELDEIRSTHYFLTALGQYARGEKVVEADGISESLAWYLLRNGVPVSTLLVMLRGLARDAHSQCLGRPSPEGTDNVTGLDQGIKEVLHGTGTKMTTALGSGWSVRSLDEIIKAWNSVG